MLITYLVSYCSERGSHRTLQPSNRSDLFILSWYCLKDISSLEQTCSAFSLGRGDVCHAKEISYCYYCKRRWTHVLDNKGPANLYPIDFTIRIRLNLKWFRCVCFFALFQLLFLNLALFFQFFELFSIDF